MIIFLNRFNLHCVHFYAPNNDNSFKETRSVTMKIFRKKYFLLKSCVKVVLCYVFQINMFSTAENCKEKRKILLQ